MAKIKSKQLDMPTLHDNTSLVNSGDVLQIKDAGVSSAKLAGGAVITAKLANDAVTADKLADNAVVTANIVDANVTTAKLADASVTGAKLANTTVTAAAYGSASKSLSFTVDAQGRLTAAAEQNIDIPHTQVNDFDAGVQANRLDQMAAPTAPVSMNTQKLTNLAAPVNSNDAVRKADLDSLIAGIAYEEPVKDRLSAPPATPATGDRYLVIATASGDWLGDEDTIQEWDGTAWVQDTAVDTGSTVLVLDENILYSRKSDGSWVQISLPTDYAFGNGLVATNGVIDLNVRSEFAIVNDQLQIANNGVTVDMLADLAQGSLVYGNNLGQSAALSAGADNTVLQVNGSDIGYGLLVNDNIDANAAIAITKLQHKTISGVDLGSNLFGLTAATNGGIEVSSFNGSAAVSDMKLDFKKVEGKINQGSLGAAVSNVRTAQLMANASLPASGHIARDEVLIFRNGVLYEGSYASPPAAAGNWEIVANGTNIDFKIYESNSGDFDNDDWRVFFAIQD